MNQDEIGLPIIGDFILLQEEDRPYYDKQTGTYVHTYTAVRHVPEPLTKSEDLIYVLDFIRPDDRPMKDPALDKAFWMYGRLQGIRMSDKPGDIRMSILVNSWSYNFNEVIHIQESKVAQTVKQILAVELQPVSHKYSLPDPEPKPEPKLRPSLAGETFGKEPPEEDDIPFDDSAEEEDDWACNIE